MKILYHLTKKDYFAFQRYYAIRTLLSLNLYVWLLNFVIVCYMVFIIFYSSKLWFLIVVSAIIFGYLFFRLLEFYQTYRHFKKNSPVLLGEQQLELSEKGLKATNAVLVPFLHVFPNNYTRTWEEVYGFKELKNYYLLFISKADAFIIPKESFSSTEERGQFQNKIKNYLKNKI